MTRLGLCVNNLDNVGGLGGGAYKSWSLKPHTDASGQIRENGGWQKSQCLKNPPKERGVVYH